MSTLLCDLSNDTESESESNIDDDSEHPINDLPENEVQALAILSFVNRHNLTGAAADDLMRLFKALYPKSGIAGNKSYREILELVKAGVPKIIHYCSVCERVFPEDPDIYIYAPLKTAPGFAIEELKIHKHENH